MTVGSDSPDARAARAASGGAAPASAGDQPVKAGDLPVAVAAKAGTASATRSVKVDVSDTAKGRAAGVLTPLVSLIGNPSDDVTVSLDVKALSGQGWGDRARLVSLPACALTTPDAAECRIETPVAAILDAASGTLTADVKLPAEGSTTKPASVTGPGSHVLQAGLVQASTVGAPMVLAATSSPSGPNGNYTATSLNPSMAWSAGANVGNFTYSYPIQTPLSLGKLAPSVSLSYDSSAVDGKTSAQNAQSSWIGAGWDYQAGFIERTYKSCSKDGIASSGDLCWGGQNATISLAGHSGALVRDDSTGIWHPQSDDGSKIEQLTGAPNGLPTGEYWRLTTNDGTQYYFGQNHLPGGDGTDPATNSAWAEPVYSPNNGDPCYNSGSGQSSNCVMGWRWNLDYVVDTHQNLITYTYAGETNKYTRGGGQNNGNGTLTTYTRGGNLQTIGYGQRLPEQVAAKGTIKAADLVTFTTSERCVPSGSITCDPSQRTAANQAYWPDVPLDQACDGTGSCTNYSPSFFTTKRLTSISTSVLVNGTYTPVDSWALGQSFRDPGDGTPKTLWLDSITRTGSTGGTAVSLPAVTFTPVEKANRVDGLFPAEPVFNQPRIQQITTETGGQINVIYSQPNCSRSSKEDDNRLPCQPVHWYLPGSSSTTPVNDWFNKYLVTAVTQQDGTTGAPVVSTNYTYNGDAAWHRNDAQFTDPATRTWDGFRGYQSVTITTGSGNAGEAPKTQKTVTYLRGMDGDYKLDGSQRSIAVTSPLGGTVTDSDWLSGKVLATQTYSQAGGQVIAMTGTAATGQQATATQTQSGGMPALVARYPGSQATETTKELLADGTTWRTTTAVTTTDPAHGNRELTDDDRGDGTASAPEICTTSTYANSSNPMLTGLVSEKKAVAGPCGTTATATNTISDTRTFFDGQAIGQAGAVGDPTGTQELDHYDSSSNPVYISTGTTTYDSYGRPLAISTTDGSTYSTAGSQLSGANTAVETTTTAYTPASGSLPTSVSVTAPLGWTTTSTQDPGRALPLTSSDPNGRVTTEQYDGLGRLTALWEPQRSTTLPASIAYTYSVNGTASPSAVTTRTLREVSGSTNFSWKTEIYDGLGRIRQSQATLATGGAGRLISDTAYDSHGWAIKTTSPYYDPNSSPNSTIFSAQDSQIPAETWTTYDGLGRATNRAFMSYAQPQWSTTTAYPGADRTDVTPPQGTTATSTVTDARGRTTALWQYHTAAPTGHAGDADVTTYAYTPAGQPASRTDAAGNTWSYTYDLRGRQVSATDPDTGTRQTFYAANSRIDHTTDAKGNTLAYSYDLVGRKTGLYSGSVAPANQLAGWVYDTLAKGKPTSSTRYVGGANGQAYTEAVTGYDTAYRPKGTSVTIPSTEGALAGTYKTSYVYNPILGTVKTMTLPAMGGLPSEIVGYVYSDTGALVASGGNDTLVNNIVYDAWGRPTRTTIGPIGTQVVSTQQYDPATGHLITSWIDRQTSPVSADQIGYTYTPSGAITSISDNQNATATDRQCFAYDYLGRLTQAWTDTGSVTTNPTGAWYDSSGAQQSTGTSASVPGVGACTNASGPSTTGALSVGGPTPYWQSYSYDATGNRTRLVQHDTSGNTANDTTTTQTFATPGTVNTPTTAPNTGGGTGGPHALLTSSTATAAGTTTASYQYDQLGNTTAVTATGGTTNLTWDGEDKLSSFATTGQTSGATYLYDADGNQLIRRDPGKTTLNIGPDELTLDTASGSMTDVRYYGSPGGITITRVTSATGGGTLVYQAADPHGTNSVQITTDTSQTITRRATDPFGNPRGTQSAPGTWSGDKGFVGGLLDPATGLTNLGAREYQPATGRFLNPDPIIDQADPQQWNGYAYSSNDPVDLSDPTGMLQQLAPGSDERIDHWAPPIGFHRPSRKAILAGMLDKVWQTITAPPPTFFGVPLVPYIPVPHAIDHPAASILGVHTDSEGYQRGQDIADAAIFTAGVVAAVVDAGAVLDDGLATGLARAGRPKGGNSAGRPHDTGGGRGGSCPVRNSFPAGTPVLLADGTSKAIDTLTVGDQVTATDPQSGETKTEPVTATIVGHDDTQFTELTLTNQANPRGDSSASTLKSTQHHPYWDITTNRWTDARDLKPGDHVLTTDNITVTVQAVRNYETDAQIAYNLTVAELHTYYVLAGTTPVLVHNSCATNSALADLPIHAQPTRFYARAGEMLDRVAGNPTTHEQMFGSADARHGGVSALSNDDLIRFGGPSGQEPITGFRDYAPGDDIKLPGSRLHIVDGNNRTAEIANRVLSGQMDPNTLIEVMIGGQ
ncbi:hypothetical protein C7C46_29145 [Streptomyces tateyamensis]|uniref:Hint domain-containing protein n=1 Tax=Streptomyces tateyamensis TaxID=565073 RepID=A0A2V4NUG9_9ACTN|nr:hypothetical protein C7C46_29145 [Streptomyces tateyamensis]